MGLLGIINHRTMTVLTAEPTTLVLLTKAAFEEIVQRTGGHEDYSLLRDAAKMQNLSDDKESFCDLACFSRLEREFVSALCEQLETRLLYPGNVLMKENENGNEMFILYAGMCKVAKGGIHLADLGNGVVIGELAVLGSDKRRTATVTITSLTLVYVLNGDVVHDILERFPNAKKIYDHEYVARLLHFELHKVKDEIEHLNNFYGKAHPMKTADVRKHIMGIDDDPTTLNSGGKSKKFAIEPPKEEGLSEFQKRMTQVQT
ncbi:unnamed protein product [Polarella glacialis]|uniref:Cyclic nucleotide-binding domain-containing protein n=1 Tax=Polarella glacialis TaxID=89957 RepID=A0A813LAP4_POLGL|nr:unnamed protein product [Polarella glacialis]